MDTKSLNLVQSLKKPDITILLAQFWHYNTQPIPMIYKTMQNNKNLGEQQSSS